MSDRGHGWRLQTSCCHTYYKRKCQLSFIEFSTPRTIDSFYLILMLIKPFLEIMVVLLLVCVWRFRIGQLSSYWFELSKFYIQNIVVWNHNLSHISKELWWTKKPCSDQTRFTCWKNQPFGLFIFSAWVFASCFIQFGNEIKKFHSLQFVGWFICIILYV